MRAISKLAIGAGIALGGVLVVPGAPAMAAAGPNYHGSDYSQTLNYYDDYIRVCDREADGNGVSVHYYLDLGGGYHEKGDANGSASPCYATDWSATPYSVTQFKTFEANVASSQAWTYTGW